MHENDSNFRVTNQRKVIHTTTTTTSYKPAIIYSINLKDN